MICPYCKNEMQHGEITVDRRSPIIFRQEGVKRTLGDMFWGVGRVQAGLGNGWKQGIPADYCPQCKKMIFDTEITK